MKVVAADFSAAEQGSLFRSQQCRIYCFDPKVFLWLASSRGHCLFHISFLNVRERGEEEEEEAKKESEIFRDTRKV